jgi:structural maintenance of chromosome 4
VAQRKKTADRARTKTLTHTPTTPEPPPKTITTTTTNKQGIVFSVRPPKKSWKHIANLSGGEKTLSSLSLVFALHHYKPTPLYVMDEIDAALDFKNVSIGGSKNLWIGCRRDCFFVLGPKAPHAHAHALHPPLSPATTHHHPLTVGHYIKERTKNAQFVIISLRNNMFELADRLVGIYKTDNATKTVAINPGEFCVGAAAAATAAAQGKAGAGAKAAAAAAADGDGRENQRPAGRRTVAAA